MRTRLMCLIVFLSLLMSCQNATATIVNVPNDQPNIQDGIYAALNGDTVFIENGTYTGTVNRNLYIPYGRNIVIQGEDRDLTIIDVGGLSYYGFRFDFSQEDNNTIIENLTVQNAVRGVSLVESGPILRNLNLLNNTIGVYHANQWGTLRCNHCYFSGNDTGVVSYIVSQNSFRLDSCTLDNNDYGIFGTFTMTNSEIANGISGLGCKAGTSTPGNYFYAAHCNFHDIGDTVIHAGYMSSLDFCDIQNNDGLIAYGSSSHPDISNVGFDNCHIDDNAGGIYLHADNAYLYLGDSRFTGNGSGIDYYCDNVGLLSVVGCHFLDNFSDVMKFGTFTSDVTIRRSVFGYNGAGHSAIDADTVGGNLSIYSSTFSQLNNFGIKVMMVIGDFTLDSSIVANNSIHGVYIEDGILGNTYIACNDVWNNTVNYSGLSDQTGSNGNISVDPQFCDSTVGDYHLLATSPCAAANNSCGIDMGGRGVGCDELRPLIITGYSPLINMTVTDPQGYVIGLDANDVLTQTIFPASYVDGPTTDIVTIPYPKAGTYTIEVIAEAARSTYYVGIRIDGTNEAIMTADAEVPPPGESDIYEYVVEAGWHFINGDANRDGIIDILDIVLLINFKYKGGPAPYPILAGEANCNQVIDILDIVILINYKYKGGDAPCELPDF